MTTYVHRNGRINLLDPDLEILRPLHFGNFVRKFPHSLLSYWLQESWRLRKGVPECTHWLVLTKILFWLCCNLIGGDIIQEDGRMGGFKRFGVFQEGNI